MERVLVAYATKYGATKGIAERIGRVLQEAGLPADVLPARDVRDLGPYRAVVLGSAVYIFHWRKEAVRLLKTLAAAGERPVWLFSSGPTSETDTDAFPNGEKLPKAAKPLAESLRVRDVAVFRGASDPATMNPIERWMMSNMKAPAGDFRQWDAIEAWAREIAQALGGSVR